MISSLAARARATGPQSPSDRGMLFAAGMIAGESLTGVLLAIPIVASGRADVLALPDSWRLGEHLSGQLLGLGLYAALAWLLLRVASGPATARRSV
jgi:hypothetical protein